MDFRKVPCNCSKNHNWVLHVEDHFSKYSWLSPLKHKETKEVAQALESLFWMFGFPTTLHSDNGKEFKSKVMSEFCAKHKIKQVHGAPRNPSTKGLVERANETTKENISNLIKEKTCHQTTGVNILEKQHIKKTIHKAIGKIPYQIVFGCLLRKEITRVAYK